jgi:hypothetical protein
MRFKDYNDDINSCINKDFEWIPKKVPKTAHYKSNPELGPVLA